jgi:hypothetical protein
MGKRRYTAEQDRRIRDGYAINELVANIAADLGVTKNAIIGRARRLGLCDQSRSADNGKKISALAIERWQDPEFREVGLRALEVARSVQRRLRSAA